MKYKMLVIILKKRNDVVHIKKNFEQLKNNVLLQLHFGRSSASRRRDRELSSAGHVLHRQAADAEVFRQHDVHQVLHKLAESEQRV